MLSAITGDILGSIHEKIPHHELRLLPTPTDDSFLTCACYDWIQSLSQEDILQVKNSEDIRNKLKMSAVIYLKKWWAKYPNEGFSKGFNIWAGNPEFIQGYRNTNGCLMRQSPIPQYCVTNDIPLDICLVLCEVFASPTHDHPDTYAAVQSHAKAIYWSLTKYLHPYDLKYLMQNTPYKIQPLDYWKEKNVFIWDAPQSLAIAYSALYYAHDFQSMIDNCIYIGGDVDTYGAIAAPIAVSCWPIGDDINKDIEEILKNYPDIQKMFLTH